MRDHHVSVPAYAIPSRATDEGDTSKNNKAEMFGAARMSSFVESPCPTRPYAAGGPHPPWATRIQTR